MNDIVYRVLADRITICVEETKWIIAATVNSEANTCNVVIGVGGRLRTSKRALVVAVAYVELIVAAALSEIRNLGTRFHYVLCAVRLQILGFHLYRIR